MNKKVQFCDVKGEAEKKAEMAKIAYEDGKQAKPLFKKLGYTGHKFIDHDGAQAIVYGTKKNLFYVAVVLNLQNSMISKQILTFGLIKRRLVAGYTMDSKTR